MRVPAGASVEVVDLTGRVVISTTAQGAQFTINVGTLQEGLYLLNVRTESEVLTSRFVKQ